jgi:hypothetical protein
MTRKVDRLRLPIGRYGAGTLWYERNGLAAFILFGSKKIAQLGPPDTPQAGTWITLEPEWKVTTPFGVGEILVQHRDNEGVVIAMTGGTR